MKFSVTGRHVMLSILCEFRENWRRVRDTCLKGVNAVTFTRGP